MHKFSHSKQRALIFSCLYTFANYRFYLVFNQNVLAESLAYTFVPLALIGFYETVWDDQKQWPLLALGMTLLIYSHMLTSFLVALFLLVSLFIFGKAIDDLKGRLFALIKAAGLCLLLTAFYLVPFFEQTLNNHLRASWTGFHFVQTPMQIIEGSLNNQPDQVIGFIFIVILFMGCVLVGKAGLPDKYMYFSSIVFIILSSSLVPWDAFLDTPLANLQFPYRLNGLASFTIAVYTSFVADYFIKKVRKDHCFASGILVLIIALFPLFLNMDNSRQIMAQRQSIPFLNKKPTPEKYYPIENNASYNLTVSCWKNLFYYTGHNGDFDYLPLKFMGKSFNGVQPNQYVRDVALHYALVDGHKVNLNARRRSKPNQITYDLSSIKSGSQVTLPVIYYHNDVVKVGNGQYFKPQTSKQGTIVIKVPKKHKTVKVKYQDSFLDKASLVLSIVGWLLVLVIYIKQKLEKLHERVY